MSKKAKWIRSSELPSGALKMLEAFEAVSGLHDSGYKIVHCREDAVFVQVYGMCNLYMLARLAVQTDIYVELEATTRQYWTLRMFNSDFLTGDHLARRKEMIKQPLRDYIVSTSLWIREDAISELIQRP